MRLLSIGLWSLLLLSATASVRADEAISCRANRVASRQAYRHGRQPVSVAPMCVAPAASAPVAASVAITTPAPTASADAELAAEVKEDQARLQGAWQRTEDLPNGDQLRMEKTIVDHHETLKTFNSEGRLLREQQAELKFERAGDLRVVRWSQAEVTAGPGKGSKIDDGTIVYTFKDGQWVSIIGLVQAERWGVYTEAWKRDFDVKAGK